MAKRPPARTKVSDPAPPAEPKVKRPRAAAPAPAAPAPAASVPAASAPAAEPSLEDIRRRAYERYQERGGRHGQHFDDWLEAEKDLKRRTENAKP